MSSSIAFGICCLFLRIFEKYLVIDGGEGMKLGFGILILFVDLILCYAILDDDIREFMKAYEE